MKEKDYHSIHEKYFNEYIDEYINEMEGIYKSSLEEGDAEDIAHECCITILKEKVIDLKIKNQPHSKLYSIFTRRTKLVQDTNPNRLYTKYIIPACEELRNELNEDIIEDYIKEFATLEVHYLLLDRYVDWSGLYKMMFDLKDFTEFRIIKNANFPEGTEILKKYKSKSNSNSNNEKKGVEQSKKIVNNFKIKDHFKQELMLLYNDLTLHFINGQKTSQKDFIKVFGENWEEDSNSFVQFKCTTQLAAYMLRKLEVLFDELTYTNILDSKKFKSKQGNIFKDKNLSKSLGEFEKKISEDIISDKEKLIKIDLDTLIENFIK